MKINPKKIINIAQRAIDTKTPVSIYTIAHETGRDRLTVKKVLIEAGLLDALAQLNTSPLATMKRMDELSKQRELRREIKRGLEEIKKLQMELRIRDELDGVAKKAIIHTIEIKKEERKEATAFALGGDWHFDEIIRSEAIGGVNEFNLSIAKRRASQFFERVLKLLRMCRKESRIDRLVFTALGDFMSGWIHEELISETTPPETLLHIYEELVSGIQFILTNGGLKELLFVGVCGNHGRITLKPHYKKQAEKNYEWLLYQFLAMRRWDESSGTKIKFLLPKGYFNWINVYGREIRIHHGNEIRYQGGVGGIHIPLRKAIAQWNKARRADLDILGHWHTREVSRDYVMNGSLVGYSEFSQAIKADFEPPSQSFFIIHPKYGKTAEFQIVLD